MKREPRWRSRAAMLIVAVLAVIAGVLLVVHMNDDANRHGKDTVDCILEGRTDC